ncbi:MAG: hypothetical protein DRG50_05335 [Deltaproteobacteria bacterium]|nr:MAG: hypothetical protein DRG50_05335 [Deltaproteobacteria bacterium]
MEWKEMEEKLVSQLRLRTNPVGLTLLNDLKGLPQGVRRPREDLGIKITLCQALGLARIYGWRVVMRGDDLVCLPAYLAFGFGEVKDRREALERLIVEMGWLKGPKEAEKTPWFFWEKGYEGIMMEPLGKVEAEPDLILIYGNPAQVVKLVQGYTYGNGGTVALTSTGKLACTEAVIGTLQEKTPRVIIPGAGDRIFSAVQDNELIFSLPTSELGPLLASLAEAGKKIGSHRYPHIPYLLYRPRHPRAWDELARELGIEL